MRPKPISTPYSGETDMFRNRLDNMIDMRHELVRLTGLIEWKRFEEAFGTLYAEKGRPGLPTRLMVGLHLLKHTRGISDDQVCAQWIENAYFQTKLARKHGVGLRQSYLRLATRARREVGRLIHGRGHKQAMRYLRKMRTWTGRLVRDIERKIEGRPDLQQACEPKLRRVKAFLAQKPDDKNKIYALHAPRSNASPKARRARATNSGSRRPSPSPTRAPTAVSSS